MCVIETLPYNRAAKSFSQFSLSRSWKVSLKDSDLKVKAEASSMYRILSSMALSIHSGYFYSTSSSPLGLLLRGAPDTKRDRAYCVRVSRRSETDNCELRACPRSLRGGLSGIRTRDPSAERRRIYQ